MDDALTLRKEQSRKGRGSESHPVHFDAICGSICRIFPCCRRGKSTVGSHPRRQLCFETRSQTPQVLKNVVRNRGCMAGEWYARGELGSADLCKAHISMSARFFRALASHSLPVWMVARARSISLSTAFKNSSTFVFRPRVAHIPFSPRQAESVSVNKIFQYTP